MGSHLCYLKHNFSALWDRQIFGIVQFPEAIVNHRIRIVSFDRCGYATLTPSNKKDFHMETLPDHRAMSLEAADSKSIDAKAICLFYGVTFALGLSISLPLWQSGQGLRLPTARILLTVMMFAPAVGVLVVRLFLPKSVIPLAQTTGLGIGRWPQSLGYWLFAWFGLTMIGLATPFVGALLGMFHLDLENFSGYHHLLLQRPDGDAALARFPVQTWSSSNWDRFLSHLE